MRPTDDRIQAIIVEFLKDMTKMWDLNEDEIGPETKVVADLGFSSVDIIHLMASIETRFDRKLPYDEIMMKDGHYTDDISVRELVDFVSRNFERAAPGPQPM